MLARKKAWAVQQGLHPNAVEVAGKYLNLDETRLKLISAYEDASDIASESVRKEAQRKAFDAIIVYLRSIEPPSEDAA
jgi:hypothetical protein